ncbi:hypothetical protein ES703_91904 [subsurface metagenome]
MVAGDDEASLPGAFSQLNSNARAGGVPSPFGPFCRIGYLHRFRPGCAIVIASAHPDSACVPARVFLDCGLAVVAAVPGHQQVDGSGLPVYDGAGITASIGVLVPDDLLSAPGFATVFGAFEEQVYIATV